MMPDVFQWLAKEGDNSQKTYIVLGCHRGGTSFVAQALKDAGVTLQGHSGRNEDSRFVHLNREIIYHAGGRWQYPPKPEAILQATKDYESQIRELIEKAKDGQAAWAWKDPQQVLTAESMVPIWLEMFDDVYLICVFRKPERTAKSLKRLGQHGQGVNFAQEYARRTIRAIKAFMRLDDE